MAEPSNRQSTRQRKPIIPFDEQISQPSLLLRALKTQKRRAKPSKSSQRAPIQAETSEDDAIQLLCDQTKGLDLDALPPTEETEDTEDESRQESVSDKNAKKKAKAAEVARLKKLSLGDIIEMIPDPKDVVFEPFSPGCPREPEVHIPPNVDATDPLTLLHLFISPEIFTTIAENTNLYAITSNAPTAPTSMNRRYWWPTNADEIRVFFGIFYCNVALCKRGVCWTKWHAQEASD